MFCHTHGIQSDIPRLSTNQHSGPEQPFCYLIVHFECKSFFMGVMGESYVIQPKTQRLMEFISYVRSFQAPQIDAMNDLWVYMSDG